MLGLSSLPMLLIVRVAEVLIIRMLMLMIDAFIYSRINMSIWVRRGS